MVPLSVAIITFNEEKNLARCLSSITAIADEIIVLDSFSTDQTKEIALQFGVQFYQEKFKGYIEQKNRALELTTNDFILSLDADEAIDEKLQKAIQEEKQKGFPGMVYRMNRCTNYCGKFIRHGLWYPDRKLRLFNKNYGKWGGVNPHDKIILQGNWAIQHLPGEILHYSFTNHEAFIQQNEKFSTISARHLFEKGKKTNLFKVIFNPAWAFLNGYFLRRGFLDGLPGFVIARGVAYATYQKHKKLLQLQNTQRIK